MKCNKCGFIDWYWANIGIQGAKQCLDCGEVYSSKGEWVEITKGQIDECLKQSDNYDFAWAIEAICKKNNGY
jgi:hypothetical protein